jgi:LysR family transcriptional regulator, glycine cleavage system transcriptional activator
MHETLSCAALTKVVWEINVSKRLPPLGALRAFEVAARHLSFKKAAAELHVSPAAISHQISTLEDYLGATLFERLNRGLKLTDIGRAGLSSISNGFQALEAGVEMMRSTQGHLVLTVSTGPAFAARWLVPRLQHFAAAHPDIDVRINASMHSVDGHSAEMQAAAEGIEDAQNSADIEVRFGSGVYPGFQVDKLLSVSLLPVCSPRLLADMQALHHPRDLRHYTLLHDDAVSTLDGNPDWRSWLNLAGASEVNAGRGTHFTHGALALQAATEGVGVALAIDALSAADIAAGRLVAPFAQKLSMRAAYYVVSPLARAHQPQVAAFRAWLLREAAAITVDRPAVLT